MLILERGNRIIPNIRDVIKHSKIQANCYFGFFFTFTRTERSKNYAGESLTSTCRTAKHNKTKF